MLSEFANDTRVVHCNKEQYDVYIGRPSEFGNPFTHIKDKHTLAKFIVRDREEAISKYREWIYNQPILMTKLLELDGKILGCWCKKTPTVSCHGDVIIEAINYMKNTVKESDI